MLRLIVRVTHPKLIEPVQRDDRFPTTKYIFSQTKRALSNLKLPY